MKRRLKLLIILFIVMLFTTITNVNAENNDFTLTMETESTTISREQKTVEIVLKIGDYISDGNVGYEGKLVYDKTVFSKVEIVNLNNWDCEPYSDETGKIVATTDTAVAQTEVLKLIFTLKENIDVEETTIQIDEMIISDGNTSTETSLSKKISIEQIIEEDEEKIIDNIPVNTTPQDTTVTQKEIPKTGIGVIKNVILVVVLLGTFCYIRHKSIIVK